MNFASAIHALEQGKCIQSSKGTQFWLTTDAKSRPVLMSQPVGYDRPVKHAVFGSTHFSPSLTWQVVPKKL